MKSEFLSHAAHELRTPMASIYGFTELLMSQEFDAATRRDLLATIHKQTEWLVNIINELLDLSRIEARRGMDFVIEAVPLAPLVREVVEALRIDAARWPVSVEIADDMPVARADAAKLRQALTNVLGNAVKYSPAGGAITVCGVLRAVDGNSRVGIAVTDHGIGMTPEQIARVGERFYRADTSGNIPGSGLGMAIVKEIVLLLGGSLDIASTPREGTTAILWVPVFGAVGDQPAGPLSTESFQEKS
jgi:signal transduction histidine kinase